MICHLKIYLPKKKSGSAISSLGTPPMNLGFASTATCTAQSLFFLPARLILPFPSPNKQSSCLLQSWAETGQRVFKGKSTCRSHAFPFGIKQTGRLEEAGAGMLVQGSCCSFPLALQCQMAGPFLLAMFWCATASTGWPRRREGGRSVSISECCGCVANEVSQLPCRSLSLALNLRIWDLSCPRTICDPQKVMDERRNMPCKQIFRAQLILLEKIPCSNHLPSQS